MSVISESLTFCNKKYNASILGYVIMPNHLHLILHFEKCEKRSSYLRDFKKFTSTKIRKEIERLHPEHLYKLKYSTRSQVFKVWQDSFDEFGLKSKSILEQKLDYIHNNPLQEHWNLVKEPQEYNYSSASFYELGVQKDIEVINYLEFL